MSATSLNVVYLIYHNTITSCHLHFNGCLPIVCKENNLFMCCLIYDYDASDRDMVSDKNLGEAKAKHFDLTASISK